MDEILQLLRDFRDQRNWAQFHTPKDLALSVSVESAELLELFQWRPEAQPLSEADRSKVAEEAADVLLYTIMLLDVIGRSPLEEAKKKIRQNRERFPVDETYGKPGSKLHRS